jgi:predicted transcriptional regulator
MVQQELLDWPGDPGPNVHTNARDTEQQAAEFIAPKVTGLRLKALESLASAQSGLTGSQVADKMGAWLYSVKPRLTELDRMGLIEDSERREKNDRGRQEIVWQITDAGMAFLEGVDG